METISRKEWNQLRRAADDGVALAQFELGSGFEWGVQDPAGRCVAAPNRDSAKRWYLAAAQAGHAAAQSAMSRLLSADAKTLSDLRVAIAWGKKAVAQGDFSAAFNLATVFRDMGQLRQALSWYRCAESMGDGDATLQIGLSLMFGLGVRRDVQGARSAFLRVISGGTDSSVCQRSREDARFWLAVIDLIDGRRHTKRSLSDARALLEWANRDGDHEQANALLNLIGKTQYRVAHLRD